MSVAAKWKLKEKEAAAAAAAAAVSKTGAAPVLKGRQLVDAPVKEAPCVASDLGCGSPVVSKTSEKSTRPELQKPTPITTGNAGGKQGHSKLPVGKDTLRMPQGKEINNIHVNDSGPAPSGTLGSSKIPVGGKESAANPVGRRTFGAGVKKEEPIKTKAEVQATQPKIETEKDAATDDAKTATFGSGRTKGLAGFWANQTDEVKSVKKKRLTAVEDSLAPTVVENTPQQLEGVIRSQDPGEWQKPIQMQEGWTKNVVSSLQMQKQSTCAKKSPISLHESTADEMMNQAQDTETKKVVKVKDISQHLVRQQSEPQKPREKLVIDRSQGSIVLAENQPDDIDPNVVRSETTSEEVVLEKGRTRNLLKHWLNTEVEYNSPKTSTSRLQGTKPAWILEIEAAKGNQGAKAEEYADEDEREMHVEEEETSRQDLPFEKVNETAELQTTGDAHLKTVAIKIRGSETDKIKSRDDGEAVKETPAIDAFELNDTQSLPPKLSGNPGSDKELPLVDEDVKVIHDTKLDYKVTEEHEMTSSVTNHENPVVTSDGHRGTGPGDQRFNQFRVDEDSVVTQSSAKIEDVESVGGDIPNTLSPKDPDICIEISSGFSENTFNRESQKGFAGEEVSQSIPSEEAKLEEFRDSFLDKDLNTAAPEKHLAVTDLPEIVAVGVNYESKIENAPFETMDLSSAMPFEVEKGVGEFLTDSLPLESEQNSDEEPKQSNLFETDILEHIKQMEKERDERANVFASDVQLQRSSEVPELLLSADKSECVFPESETFSAPTSGFDLLTLDSPVVSTSDNSGKTETKNSSPTLDDLLRIDPPSSLLDEAIDNTPCLVPSGGGGPIEPENSTDNRENSNDRQIETRRSGTFTDQNIDRTIESPANEVPDENRSKKKEEEMAKSETSQRSCRVM